MNGNRPGRILVAVFSGVVLLSGCTLDPVRRLPPGTTAEEVRSFMGEPRERYAEADGGSTWAYPTGPMGYYTYMVQLDAAGKVVRVEQVLDDKGFARIVLHKSTKEDVRHLLGPPWRTTYFPRQHELVWDYYIHNAWLRPAQFHVIFDDNGVAKQTMQIEEFYGDGKIR
jgi:outer membrane protein assembly factor BamE (lipoprotein component of BamABCDE complex)